MWNKYSSFRSSMAFSDTRFFQVEISVNFNFEFGSLPEEMLQFVLQSLYRYLNI
jgi:hypothetical protein